METLGSLCDKLTIVKLKQWHSEDLLKLESLKNQESLLTNEIDEFLLNSFTGNIPLNNLKFTSNKIYMSKGNEIKDIVGSSIGVFFAELAAINCKLWHEQEKVYDFESVPVNKKNEVVKNLALMNLERTSYIDKIDNIFFNIIEKVNKI